MSDETETDPLTSVRQLITAIVLRRLPEQPIERSFNTPFPSTSLRFRMETDKRQCLSGMGRLLLC